MLKSVLNLLKSPYFLITISVVSMIIIYISVSKSTPSPIIPVLPKCTSPGTYVNCPDGKKDCGLNCPVGQKWDCTLKKCVCLNSNSKLCNNNSQCCDTCENDVCCSASNQIINNGVVSCCSPGTIPAKSVNNTSGTPDICLVKCGNSTCNQGEECVKVSNLNATTYNNLISDPNISPQITSKDPSTNTITYCYGEPTCQFGDENALPSAINNNYPYYNFQNKEGYSKFSACIPRSQTDTTTTCFNNDTSQDCNGIPTCKWVSMPDDYDGNGPVGTQIQNYMVYKGNSSQGYYCDPGGLTLGRVSQFKEQSGNCGWKDCLNQISNQGTIDVNWDGTNCNSFKVPPYQNTGLQPVQQLQCSGPNSPCSSCKSTGQFINAIKCTGVGVPCANCTSVGQIICVDDNTKCEPISNNNNWTFNTCVPKATDGTDTMVLNSSGGGNCPWGCNGSSGQNCYNVNIPSGSGNIFGQNLSDSNDIVCLNDGQIHPEPKAPIYALINNNGNYSCSSPQTCPTGTTCESSLCDCIFKPQVLFTGSFVIYTIFNGQKLFLSSFGAQCNSGTSFWATSNYKKADTFALSSDAYKGIGIWSYGTPPNGNGCGAIPLTLSPSVDLCVPSNDNCPQGSGQTAYFWNGNQAISYNALYSNTPYYITSDNTGSNFLSGYMNWNSNAGEEDLQLYIGNGSNGLLFNAVPSSLLNSQKYNC